MVAKAVDVVIRQEKPQDRQHVFEVNASAFETGAEAELVEAFRFTAEPVISLVAILGDRLVGHIMFTPVKVQNVTGLPLTLALGPVAVVPDIQNRWIGSKLVRAGLAGCRALGAEAVFVLGHLRYYPRFGFQAAAPFGLRYESEEYDPFFMVLELRPKALALMSGFVEYLPEFNEV